MSQFAKKAGTTAPRISRHLDAWNGAAATGACRPSDQLTPADAESGRVRVPDKDTFLAAYPTLDEEGKRRAGGTPRASVKEVADALATDESFRTRVVEELGHEAAEELMVDAGRRAEETRPAHEKLKPLKPKANPKATVGFGLALLLLQVNGELAELEVVARDTLNAVPAGRRLNPEDVELTLSSIATARQHLDNIEAMLKGIDDADLDELLRGGA